MNIFESIKQEFRIPHAYEDWKEYRRQLTDIILSGDSGMENLHGVTESRISPSGYTGTEEKHGSIAILGAGPCNDLDLRRISDSFDEVSLIDIDTESTKNGVISQGLKDHHGIKTVNLSITGITEELSESFFNRLYIYVYEKGMSLTETDFTERSIEEFKKLEEHLYKSQEAITAVLPQKNYDVIVAAGLHSQLWSILSYSWHVLAGNVSEQILSGRQIDPEPFHEYIREVDDRFIPYLNSAIIGSAGERAVFASEYDPNHPSEGAWQCIRDLRKRFTSGEIDLRESSLLWPFNPQQRKRYNMLIQDIRKLQE